MTRRLQIGGAFFSALVLLISPVMVAPGHAADKSPTPAEQAQFIASAREAALAYSSRLPDFICTQTVTRSLDRGRGLLPFDTLTFETSYYRQRETSRLTHVNGLPASEYIRSAGLMSRGEFGSNLFKIFAPASEAQFHFEKWVDLRARRAAVYSYRVARSQAPYTLTTTEGGKPKSATVGLRGELTIDAKDYSILRVEYVPDDIPRGFPMRSVTVTVDYENADIGGKQFLLPSRAEALARSGEIKGKNVSVFERYRKFAADSVIDFGAPPQP